MTLAPLVISLAVLLGSPDVADYRGLSGLDSALYGLALAGMFYASRAGKGAPGNRIALVAGLAFFVKVLYELATGATVFSAATGVYLARPSTHLAGFLMGLLVAGWRRTGSPVAMVNPYHEG